MIESRLKTGSARQERGRRPRVRKLLVVEDDSDLWLAMTTFAFQFDPWLELDFVPNANLARERLHSSIEYDAILTDFLLADSDNGYALYREWRGDPKRFAMMSSMPLSLPELAENEFLAKPFTGRELRRALNSLLGGRR